MPLPTRLDIVTGIQFNEAPEWPTREGTSTDLPAGDKVDQILSSLLRLNNLDPDLITGGEFSYLIGPDTFIINFQRNILDTDEALRVAVQGKALIPKANRFTGLAKGFGIFKAAGISMGYTSTPEGEALPDLEVLSTFKVKRAKKLSNHKFANN